MFFYRNQMKASSLHITFPTKHEWDRVADLGYLQRIGMQYHWKNRDYSRYVKLTPVWCIRNAMLIAIILFVSRISKSWISAVWFSRLLRQSNDHWSCTLGFGCSFDNFLMDLKQSKRKNIRQERKKVNAFFSRYSHKNGKRWIQHKD